MGSSATSESEYETKPSIGRGKKRSGASSVKKGGVKKPRTKVEKPAGSISAADPRVTKAIMERLLEKFDGNDRKAINEEFGVATGHLSAQWINRTKPKILKWVEAEFGSKASADAAQ